MLMMRHVMEFWWFRWRSFLLWEYEHFLYVGIQSSLDNRPNFNGTDALKEPKKSRTEFIFKISWNVHKWIVPVTVTRETSVTPLGTSYWESRLLWIVLTSERLYLAHGFPISKKSQALLVYTGSEPLVYHNQQHLEATPYWYTFDGMY